MKGGYSMVKNLEEAGRLLEEMKQLEKEMKKKMKNISDGIDDIKARNSVIQFYWPPMQPTNRAPAPFANININHGINTNFKALNQRNG